MVRLDDLELVEKINDWHDEAQDAFSAWKDKAKESYNFVAGNQWEEDDIQKLENEGRPVITFNWIGPMMAAVLGIEANQRNEVRYLPREKGDTGLADAIEEVTNWMRDYAGIGEVESTIFEDAIICGMGWSETKMDYDEDLDGKFVQERVSPLEMYWDPATEKPDLSDRRWQIRAKKYTRDEILELWPDAELPETDVEEGEEIKTITVVDPSKRYEEESAYKGKKEREFTVLQTQWFEKEPVYRARDPITGRIVELDQEKFKQAKEFFEINKIRYVKQYKKSYYQAFVCGDQLLERGRCSSSKRFTFTPLTAKRDHINKTFYGLVEAMKDPQRWSNKFFSQILDIINSNAKGGIMAEEGAFVDTRKAEEDWAKADSIVWLRPGAIVGGKVKEKPVSQYPTGLDRLMNFAIDAIRGVSGINLELLGMADREQAGVLEQIRKTSAYTILADLFNALKNYRRQSGLLVLEFMKEYIPLERIASVLPSESINYAPIVKGVDLDQVNIVVSEAPQSESNKILVWGFLTQMAPFLLKAGIPIPPEILDYSPLPATLVEKWKALLSQPPPQIEKSAEQVASITGMGG